MSRMQVTANDKLSLNTSQRAASARASPVRLDRYRGSVATGILKSTVLPNLPANLASLDNPTGLHRAGLRSWLEIAKLRKQSPTFAHHQPPTSAPTRTVKLDICGLKSDIEACDLKGTVVENSPFLSPTPYFRKGDKFTLAGKRSEKLLGALSSEAKECSKRKTEVRNLKT
jgi:hypothetical protein